MSAFSGVPGRTAARGCRTHAPCGGGHVRAEREGGA